MDGDRARVDRRVVAPDAVHQLIAREDTAWMRREEAEEVEFLRRQSHLAAALRHLARERIDRHVGEPELLFRRRWTRPPQHRAYACGELARGERLRHVVVGPDLQTDDPVCLLAAGGEHDHGDLRERAQPAADREPVQAGQHQIQHNQVGPLRLGELARLLAVARLERPVAVAAQVADDDLTHDWLVVDDQDGLHGSHCDARTLSRF